MSALDTIRQADLKAINDRREVRVTKQVQREPLPVRPRTKQAVYEVESCSLPLKCVLRKFWRWKHFAPVEVACKGTGLVPVYEQGFIRCMDMIEQTRNDAGVPLFVNSMFRTAAHNRRVGGASNSFHLYGMAIDISTDGLDQEELVKLLRKNGARGIGYYDTFVHADMRSSAYTWDRRA